MLAATTTHAPTPGPAPTAAEVRRRVTIPRALLALVWAAALVVAIGNRVPTTDSDLPVIAALLLTAYPLIDVAASLFAARLQPEGAAALRANAAISTIAALAIGAASFASDAGSALLAFGAWAVISGAIQFVLALRTTRQLSMLISGGVSTLAGLSFLAAAGMDKANLAQLAGYMAAGAVLFLVSARPGARAVGAARS